MHPATDVVADWSSGEFWFQQELIVELNLHNEPQRRYYVSRDNHRPELFTRLCVSGSLIYAGRCDGTVIAFSRVTGHDIHCCAPARSRSALQKRDGISCLTVTSAESLTLYGGSLSGSLHFWDKVSGSALYSRDAAHRGYVSKIVGTRTPSVTWTSSHDGTVKIWDSRLPQREGEVMSFDCGAPVLSIDAGNSDDLVRSACIDNSVKAAVSVKEWDVRNGRDHHADDLYRDDFLLPSFEEFSSSTAIPGERGNNKREQRDAVKDAYCTTLMQWPRVRIEFVELKDTCIYIGGRARRGILSFSGGKCGEWR